MPWPSNLLLQMKESSIFVLLFGHMTSLNKFTLALGYFYGHFSQFSSDRLFKTIYIQFALNIVTWSKTTDKMATPTTAHPAGLKHVTDSISQSEQLYKRTCQAFYNACHCLFADGHLVPYMIRLAADMRLLSHVTCFHVRVRQKKKWRGSEAVRKRELGLISCQCRR